MKNSSDLRRYSGEKIDITYQLKRCIHAEVCVKNLATVFDKNSRPWINADGDTPDQIASVIESCPSGALHYERKDGNLEVVPQENVIIVHHNGTLEIKVNLEIRFHGEIISQETRATLCRCGASEHKPFCDNSHRTIEFDAEEGKPRGIVQVNSGGELIITALKNGPLEIEGDVRIVNEVEDTLYSGQDVVLCRCGGSGNKPFCDGTHRKNQFRSE